MKKLTKYFKNNHASIFNSLVAKIFFFILACLFTHTFHILSYIKRLIRILDDPIQVKLSHLSLLLFLAYFLNLRSKSRLQLPHRNYLEDEFQGVVWRWSYTPSGIYIKAAFCPNDDTELIENYDHYLYKHKPHFYHCETCNKNLLFSKESHYDFSQKIIRQIERRIRNKEWKKAKKRLAAIKTKFN